MVGAGATSAACVAVGRALPAGGACASGKGLKGAIATRWGTRGWNGAEPGSDALTAGVGPAPGGGAGWPTQRGATAPARAIRGSGAVFTAVGVRAVPATGPL